MFAALAALACSSTGRGSAPVPVDSATPAVADQRSETPQTPGPAAVVPLPTTERGATPVPAASTSPGNGTSPAKTAVAGLVPADELVDTSEIDISTLVVPVCRPNATASVSGVFGTVPHPNPQPENGPPVSGQSLGDDIGLFSYGAKPLLDYVAYFTATADSEWSNARDPQEFARTVFAEGRRLWLACNAIANLSAPAPAESIRAAISNALLARREILAKAAGQIQSSTGDAFQPDSNRSLSSNDLLGLTVLLDVFADSAGLPLPLMPKPFQIVNSLLQLSIEAPAGSILVRNSIDIVVIAPLNLQENGVMGLGPPGWNMGTAMRIRRVRNGGRADLADVRAVVDVLYSRAGELLPESLIEIDGNDGVLRTYRDRDSRWDTLVAAGAIGEVTYLFTAGCPQTRTSECLSFLRDFVDSADFGEIEGA